MAYHCPIWVAIGSYVAKSYVFLHCSYDILAAKIQVTQGLKIPHVDTTWGRNDSKARATRNFRAYENPLSPALKTLISGGGYLRALGWVGWLAIMIPFRDFCNLQKWAHHSQDYLRIFKYMGINNLEEICSALCICDDGNVVIVWCLQQRCTAHWGSDVKTWTQDFCIIPIPCMYGIFTYIYHQNQPNVVKYTIQGWYGIGFRRNYGKRARSLF